MREIRIYVDATLEPGAGLSLPAQAAHHVARVLRLRAGQPLILFNGRGGQYPAIIKSISGRQVEVVIEDFDSTERESPLDLTLVQAVSRGRHMDYTLQKAVELGVKRIVPVMSEHGQVRLDDKRLAGKLEHWQGIIVAACEQSGRNRLPVLKTVGRFTDWLRALPAEGYCVFLDPQAQRRLRDLPVPSAGMMLLSGPEGGFSPAEREAAVKAGCIPVGLGPRILRTETAAPAAITACQALWGDLA